MGKPRIPLLLTNYRPNIHMKNTLALLTTALLSTGFASAATITVYSDTQLAKGSYLNFDVSKFNSSLGTLTGVVVSVDLSTLQGTATVTNNGAVTVGVSGYDTIFSVKQAPSSGLGYNPSSATITDVVTTPDWNTLTIDSLESKALTIGTGQNFTVSQQSIGSSYFSAYESVGGTGTVTFQARDPQSITSTGDVFTVDSSAVGANTQFAITYTYTTVPEPST